MPLKIISWTEDAIDKIDSAVFTGDTFMTDRKEFENFKYHVER